MATLAEMRSAINRKLKDPDGTALSSSDVNFEINRTIELYSRYRFWFNEDLATITLTAGTQTVPNIPSDFQSQLQVNGLTLIDSQVKIDLIKLAPDEFVERDDDQTGRPNFFTYRDGRFLLLPTPDRAYTLLFRYLKTYSDLSADTDTNDFTNNASNLIILRTLAHIYSEDKQDPELGAVYSQLAQVEYDALSERTDNLNASGYLETPSILDNNYL